MWYQTTKEHYGQRSREYLGLYFRRVGTRVEFRRRIIRVSSGSSASAGWKNYLFYRRYTHREPGCSFVDRFDGFVGPHISLTGGATICASMVSFG
jgi:hypothetical protein